MARKAIDRTLFARAEGPGPSGARRLLHGAIAAGFAAVALFAGQAWLLASVVEQVFLRHATLGDVTPLLAAMLALIVLRAAMLWLQEVLAQRSAARVKDGLRGQLSARLLALGPTYTRQERSGELVSTLVEGVEALDEYITQFLPARQLAVLGPILIFALILWLDPWSSLVLLFAGPMLVLLLGLIGSGAKRVTERRYAELSWMSAFFLDNLQGLTTLKLFGRSKEQAGLIEEISRRYASTTMEVLATAFQTSLVMEWAATAATAMVALELSVRLMNGAVGFQPALAVLLLTPEFFMPLRQLAVKYHADAAGKAAAERIFAVLDAPLPQAAANLSRPAAAKASPAGALPKQFDVQFDKVHVAYEQGERQALRGLSLTIPHGQVVALVGPTGAGKTTVANLLLRFIEPQRGRILVGGIPLNEIDPVRWREQVAWAPQTPHLFVGSVADNLRLARPAASDDELVAAAKAANAHDFILALPQGYATELGEQGMRLSGGQRQRLAIARALLKDAPLLILDEPAAHLDAASERLIEDALARLMRGRTVLVISHWLQLARAANSIAVLEKGRVVQSGPHDAVLAQDGLYRQLVATAAEAGLAPGYAGAG